MKVIVGEHIIFIHVYIKNIRAIHYVAHAGGPLLVRREDLSISVRNINFTFLRRDFDIVLPVVYLRI